MKRTLCILSVCLGLAVLSSGQVSVRVKRVTSNKKGDWEASAAYPIFSGSQLSKYANSVWKDHILTGFQKFLKESARARAEERKAGYDGHPYSYSAAPELTLKSPNFLSGSAFMQTYTGGAHGMYWSEELNIAMVNGKPIQVGLRHLLKQGIDPMKTVSPLVIKKLRAKNAAWVESGEAKALKKEQLDQFVATKYGLLYRFDPYEMGSYAEGMYEITLTWREIEDWLDRKGPAGALPR